MSLKSMTKASAVDAVDSISGARSDGVEGIRVQGRSIAKLRGTNTTAPQAIGPAAGNKGSMPRKERPNNAAAP